MVSIQILEIGKGKVELGRGKVEISIGKVMHSIQPQASEGPQADKGTQRDDPLQYRTGRTKPAINAVLGRNGLVYLSKRFC